MSPDGLSRIACASRSGRSTLISAHVCPLSTEWNTPLHVAAYRALTDPGTRPAWTEVFLDDEGRPQTREQLRERFRGRYDAHDPDEGFA